MAKKQNSSKPPRTPAEIKQEKKEAFQRVCVPRVNKAVKAIHNVGLCSSDAYISTEAEQNACIQAMQIAIDDVKGLFACGGKAKGGFKLPK